MEPHLLARFPVAKNVQKCLQIKDFVSCSNGSDHMHILNVNMHIMNVIMVSTGTIIIPYASNL